MRSEAHVTELWRHPVKSMGGERLERVSLTLEGVPGDRIWGAWWPDGVGPLSAKRVPALMRCRAALGPDGGVPRIELPDGDRHPAGRPEAAAALSRLLERPTSLWPRLPPPLITALRSGSAQAAAAASLRAALGLTPTEPLPGAEALPAGLAEVAAREVGLQDAAPLLLVTTASLAALARMLEVDHVDRRRFRPNVLIETPGVEGFVEQRWLGRRVRIGSAELEVVSTCKRCAMTTHAFDELPPAPEVLRTLTAENGAVLGVYARVVAPGALRAGDRVAV